MSGKVGWSSLGPEMGFAPGVPPFVTMLLRLFEFETHLRGTGFVHFIAREGSREIVGIIAENRLAASSIDQLVDKHFGPGYEWLFPFGQGVKFRAGTLHVVFDIDRR